MKQKESSLLFLCQFMYYTLLRTNEIASLKVKNIGQYAKDKIYLTSEFSKNRVERHIVITEQLNKLIEDLGIREYDPEFYIFSKGFVPGRQHYDSKRFGQRFRENILLVSSPS